MELLKERTRPKGPCDSVGAAGERAAAVFLISKGYRVLERNWRDGRRGELDLVVSKGGQVVFVEVKTRTTVCADEALYAVDERKLLQMRRLGAAWMAKEKTRSACRFDVLAVQLRPGCEPLFAWLQDVAP